MRDLMTRRRILQASGTVAASAALGTAFPYFPAALAADPVRWASLMPGFTTLVTEYIRHHKLDEKNGFKLGQPTEYTTVPTYYSDFVAGNYDVCIGSWDSFAVRYLSKVPIKLLCTITTADMICILAPQGAGASIDQFKGKVLAAPQSTGTYRIAVSIIREYLGIDLENWMKVQNVTNPAASVSLLRAHSADAALSWEPNVTNGMAEDKTMQVIFNAGQVYREKTGWELPYFGVAVRAELLARDPAIAERLRGVFRQCVDGIMANVPEAVKIVGDRTGFPPAVLQDSIASGRLRFAFSSMADPQVRTTVAAAAEFFMRNELLPGIPDSGFYVQS